jgi:hypothetical protein
MSTFDRKPRTPALAGKSPARPTQMGLVSQPGLDGRFVDATASPRIGDEVAEPQVSRPSFDFSRVSLTHAPAAAGAWSSPLRGLAFAPPQAPKPLAAENNSARDTLPFKELDARDSLMTLAGPVRLESADDPREISGARLWDWDASRADATAELVRVLRPQLGITWPMRIYIDERAEHALNGRSSLGAAHDNIVYIRPRRFDPRSAAGRRLLAHELAHVAQAGICVQQPALPGAAECEAREIGDAFAAGQRLTPPSARLLPSTVAHDDDVPAKEDEFIKVPKKYKIQISMSGVYFTPDPANQKWVGNIDRRLQALAAELQALIGKNYSVRLVRETMAYLEANGGITWTNLPAGPATQDDTCNPITMRSSLANQVINYLSNVRKPPVPLLLSAEQIKTLRALEDASTVYERLKSRGAFIYAWYTENIFIGVMLNNRKLLERFIEAGADENKLQAAEQERTEKLEPYEKAVSAVRRDPGLTDEPGYRRLWNMPPKEPNDTRKTPRAGADSTIDTRLAIEFLLDMQAHHTPEEIARVPLDAAFRKAVFSNWARRMALKKIDLQGDVALRDAPGKAVQAADPATMFSHPTLEPPYYDRQAGTEMMFWMSVYTANMWEHFRTWHYAWEVIRVPHDEWTKGDAVGEDIGIRGEDYGSFGRIAGSRLRRNVSNAATDVKRTLFKIENLIGPPGLGRTTLALGSSALSALGSVIKTALGKLTEKPWEYTAAIGEPGVYVVRCTATRRDDESSLIRKLPSVAYLPIWVRPPSDIIADRINVANVMAQVSDDRLKAIQKKLTDKSLSDAERKALEDEARDLVGALFGNAEAQLNVELRKLESVKANAAEWAKLEKRDQDELNRRIDDIKFILKKRADWIKDIGSDASGSPEKLLAYFIAEEGPSANRPMRLLLEIVNLKASKGMHRFAVLDNTGKESEHRTGPERSTRADAIVEAVRALLEDVNYGRGKVTIAIPKGIWDVGAKEGETRTIDIERSDKQLLFEGLENAALVASIAVIVAAPFTAGQSLALLIPIGAVGAVPSFYRLAHRVSEGTCEWDMATALDLLNCLGAAAGFGHLATSLKLIQVSTRVWVIVGVGMDGLQGIVGTYDLVDRLSKIDPTLPDGARTAEAMVIVGGAMLQLGIAIGGRMVAEGQARRERLESKSTPEANPNIVRAAEHLSKPLADAGIKEVPVLVDQSIEGPEARVHFQRDGYGLPTEIHIIAGKGATADMIRLHVETVQLLQKYSGLCGWLRTLIDRFNALLASKQFVKPGSRGWNAAAEVNKIRGIIEHYAEEIRQGKVSKLDGEAYLDYLKQEMQKHQQALDEVEEGAGFIAAQAPKSADAEAHDYPPAPSDHYYIEESPGKFQLRAHIGYEGQAKMVVPKKTGKGWDIIDRPPEVGAAQPGTAAAKAVPKASKVDPAQLQLDISQALKVSSSFVTIVSESGTQVRVLPPAETGKGYVVHVPAEATTGAVERAVARHNDLAQLRPQDLSKIPTDASGKAAWNGALEAEYRGRPTEEGYHWRLQYGKLQYVVERPEEGMPARPKRVWDDKLGKLVTETGAPEAKFFSTNPPTSKADAFDELGGNHPNTPFGKWVELVESLGFKRDALIADLQEPSGVNQNTVRHNLKKQAKYQDALKKWLTDPAELKKRYSSEFQGIDPNDKAKQDAALRKAQHRAVLDVDKYLALKDATNWTEKWYVDLFGQVPDESGAKVSKVQTQVHFDKARLTAAGIDVASTRQADLVIVSETINPKDPSARPIEKNILKDVKSHEGTLSREDKIQFDDYKGMLNKEVPRTDGTATKIDAVVEVFLDPRGGKVNAEWIASELSEGRAGVSFEVFNTKGDRKTFGAKDFMKLGNAAALEAVIRAFCDT